MARGPFSLHLLLPLALLLLLLPSSHSGRISRGAAGSGGLGRISRGQSLGMKTRVAHSARGGNPKLGTPRVERRAEEIQIESRNCSGLMYACGNVQDVMCTKDCYLICSSVPDERNPFPQIVICNFPQKCVGGTCML